MVAPVPKPAASGSGMRTAPSVKTSTSWGRPPNVEPARSSGGNSPAMHALSNSLQSTSLTQNTSGPSPTVQAPERLQVSDAHSRSRATAVSNTTSIPQAQTASSSSTVSPSHNPLGASTTATPILSPGHSVLPPSLGRIAYVALSRTGNSLGLQTSQVQTATPEDNAPPGHSTSHLTTGIVGSPQQEPLTGTSPLRSAPIQHRRGGGPRDLPGPVIPQKTATASVTKSPVLSPKPAISISPSVPPVVRATASSSRVSDVQHVPSLQQHHDAPSRVSSSASRVSSSHQTSSQRTQNRTPTTYIGHIDIPSSSDEDGGVRSQPPSRSLSSRSRSRTLTPGFGEQVRPGSRQSKSATIPARIPSASCLTMDVDSDDDLPMDILPSRSTTANQPRSGRNLQIDDSRLPTKTTSRAMPPPTNTMGRRSPLHPPLSASRPTDTPFVASQPSFRAPRSPSVEVLSVYMAQPREPTPVRAMSNFVNDDWYYDPPPEAPQTPVPGTPLPHSSPPPSPPPGPGSPMHISIPSSPLRQDAAVTPVVAIMPSSNVQLEGLFDYISAEGDAGVIWRNAAARKRTGISAHGTRRRKGQARYLNGPMQASLQDKSLNYHYDSWIHGKGTCNTE
ncbi:hypothetical protein HGRIS_005647 [Hohenbuehelia grisea]